MASTDLNRPNILFILSDDQGPWAMNCAGTSELITPNLDRLAETGIRFENFFCASPVCSPARASILTAEVFHIFLSRWSVLGFVYTLGSPYCRVFSDIAYSKQAWIMTGHGLIYKNYT